MTFTQKYRGKIVIDSIHPFISKDMSILDIGCGNGVVSYEIMKFFKCNLIGTDIQEYLKENIQFKLMKNNMLDFNDKEFDMGLFIDVLHHTPFNKQMGLIKDALRVCKEVLIFEDKPTFIAKKIDYLINQIHNTDMPITITFRTKNDWINLFTNNGVVSKFYSVKTMFYYPFTHYLFHLEKSK